MKNKIFIILLIISIIGIVILDVSGGVLRDFFSPAIEADYPNLVDIDGQMFYRLSRSAHFQDSNGDYIYILSKSEKFPEISYIAIKQYIPGVAYDELYIYLHMGELTEDAYIITKAYDSIIEGERVHITNYK